MDVTHEYYTRQFGLKKRERRGETVWDHPTAAHFSRMKLDNIDDYVKQANKYTVHTEKEVMGMTWIMDPEIRWWWKLKFTVFLHAVINSPSVYGSNMKWTRIVSRPYMYARITWDFPPQTSQICLDRVKYALKPSIGIGIDSSERGSDSESESEEDDIRDEEEDSQSESVATVAEVRPAEVLFCTINRLQQNLMINGSDLLHNDNGKLTFLALFDYFLGDIYNRHGECCGGACTV